MNEREESRPQNLIKDIGRLNLFRASDEIIRNTDYARNTNDTLFGKYFFHSKSRDDFKNACNALGTRDDVIKWKLAI